MVKLPTKKPLPVHHKQRNTSAPTLGEGPLSSGVNYVGSIVQLQTLIGNQAVQRLISQTGQSSPPPGLLPVTMVGSKEHSIMRNGGNRSRQSKPRNAPRGTKPIDESGLDRDDIHGIKDQIGAGPRDWVGITPDGHIVTSDDEGNAEDHGHVDDYIHSRIEIPQWLWKALAGVALAAGTIAVIACFATGVCEIGALIGGLGFAAAMLIIGILKDSGDSDSTASNEDGTTASSSETATA